MLTKKNAGLRDNSNIMSDAQQVQTQEVAGQQVSAQSSNENVNNYHLQPRAEGYRPAVIRESRIKDRPYTKSANDSLSIKIELDLEVEVGVPEKQSLETGTDTTCRLIFMQESREMSRLDYSEHTRLVFVQYNTEHKRES